MRGIFIVFPSNRKSFLFYMPGSRNIINSGDATFDETFYSAIATTWQQHRDTLALQPIQSDFPNATTTLEHTGTLADTAVEEGENIQLTSQTTEEEEIKEGQSDREDNAFEPDALIPDENNMMAASEGSSGPLVVDSSNSDPTAGPRRSTRPHKPNSKYANVAKTVGWANVCTDLALVEACAAEVHADLQPNTIDANSWEPAPKTIRDILKMKDGPVRQEWLKAIKKEIKTLSIQEPSRKTS
jgi:hypothetical protein